jgi:hypothetical protein
MWDGDCSWRSYPTEETRNIEQGAAGTHAKALNNALTLPLRVAPPSPRDSASSPHPTG